MPVFEDCYVAVYAQVVPHHCLQNGLFYLGLVGAQDVITGWALDHVHVQTAHVLDLVEGVHCVEVLEAKDRTDGGRGLALLREPLRAS